MKLFITTALMAIIMNVSANTKEGIVFLPEETPFEEILAKAKAENKIIFIDAYTTWCGPCKWLDQNVFTDAQVGEFFNQNFISAKFDMEKGEGLELAEKYSVIAYPTLLFVDGNGKLVHRICGASPAEKFLELAKVAIDENKRIGTLLSNYEGGQRDLSFMRNLLTNLSDACMEADDISTEFWNLQDKEEWYTEENHDLFLRFIQDYQSEQFQYLLLKKMDEIEKSETLYQYVGDVLYSSLAKSIYSNELEQFFKDYETIQKLNVKVAQEAILKGTIFKHQNSKDFTSFGTDAIKYLDTYGTDDVGYTNSLSWTIYENVTDKAIISAAANHMKAVLANGQNEYAFIDTYAALLLKAGEKEAGMKAANEAIEVAKISGEDYSSTVELIEKYN